MSDPDNSPITLPAGSYDYDELKKGLEKAATGAADKRDGAIGATLTKARGGEETMIDADRAHIPGYTLKEVDGEQIRVFDPKSPEAKEEPPATATPSTNAAA